MRIGILGGTFDPIHIGHLLAGEQAREQCQLDEVWFVPTYVPPHKDGSQVTDAVHRLQMVERAINDHPHFRVSQIELDRKGNSYTIDTIQALRERYPEDAFYFILGSDMVADLPNWHRVEHLVELTRFIGLARPGFAKPQLMANIARRVHYVPMPLLEISATDIRERVRAKKSIRYFVPEPVRIYIEEHRLYET